MLQDPDTVRILKTITHPSLSNQFNIILPYIYIYIYTCVSQVIPSLQDFRLKFVGIS